MYIHRLYYIAHVLCKIQLDFKSRRIILLACDQLKLEHISLLRSNQIPFYTCATDFLNQNVELHFSLHPFGFSSYFTLVWGRIR